MRIMKKIRFAGAIGFLLVASLIPTTVAVDVGPAHAGVGSEDNCNNYGFVVTVGVYTNWQCNASTNVCESGTGSGAGAGAGSGGGSSADAAASATAGSECEVGGDQNNTVGGIQFCTAVGQAPPICSGSLGGLDRSAAEALGLLPVGVGLLVLSASGVPDGPVSLLAEMEGSCDNYGVVVTAGLGGERRCKGESCDNYGVLVFIGPLGRIECDGGCRNEGFYVAIASQQCQGSGPVAACLGATCLSEDEASASDASEPVEPGALLKMDCPVRNVPFVCRAFFCEPEVESGHLGWGVGWSCTYGGDPKVCDAYDYPECWALRMVCFYGDDALAVVVSAATGGWVVFSCDLQPGAGGRE